MCSQREQEDSTSPALTEAERRLWENIDARVRRAVAEHPDDRWFDGSGESESDAKVPGEVGAERTAGTRTAPPPAPACSLETRRKSVERSANRKGGYELRACRCRSRFCPHCSLSEGLATRERVIKVVRKFKGLLMWTFTIDPTLFASPADAYRHVQECRCIGEWVRSMWKAGYLHSRRYFCVIEWQMGKGEQAGTVMAHYHVLLDADYIPHDEGQARWDLFRPASAGPIEPGRPGFGWAFVTTVEFATREHAAHYACKYLLKQPEKGFPDWVLDSHGEIKRYSTSKGFYKMEGDEKENDSAGSEIGDQEDELGETTAKVQTTIRERIAKCGKGTVLLQLYDAASIDNDICLKSAFVERFGELDLPCACEFLGIEIPSGARRIRLTGLEASQLRSWMSGRGGRGDGCKERERRGDSRWGVVPTGSGQAAVGLGRRCVA